MIKKFNQFEIFENKFHVIEIEEELLELIDDGILSRGKVTFEKGEYNKEKKVVYNFIILIKDRTDIKAYRQLFERLETAIDRTDVICEYNITYINIFLGNIINPNLKEFLKNSLIHRSDLLEVKIPNLEDAVAINNVFKDNIFQFSAQIFESSGDGHLQDGEDVALKERNESIKLFLENYGAFDIEFGEEIYCSQKFSFKMNLYS